MNSHTRLEALIDADQIILPDDLIVLNAQPGQFWAGFPNAQFSQDHKDAVDRLVQSGLSVVEHPETIAEASVVEITRVRTETAALIAKAARLTKTGGLVLVDGSKTDGIESHLKACKSLVDIAGSFSKAHGKSYWFFNPENRPDAFDLWEKAVEPARNRDGFLTAPGMFSADHMDPGSLFLLDHLPRLSGTGADFGAGWGGLAQAVLERNAGITSLDLIELSNAALNCAKSNVGDPRATFHWTDIANYKPRTLLDFVVTNPPFHPSRKADARLGQLFLQQAARALHKKGALWLVANRHLPYEAHLNDLFQRTEMVEETGQFKVICATRPK